MKLRELKEDHIIEALKRFLPPDAYNEDAALLRLPTRFDLTRVVMNVDAATSQDDWLPGQSLRELGYKTLMASASDLAAKGAHFVAAQASITMAMDFDLTDLIELVAGIHDACQFLGGSYLGGDFSTTMDGFVMSITTIGCLDTRARYLSRRGMLDGDIIWVSGEFGWTGYGFSRLLNQTELNVQVKKKVLQKLYRPVARTLLGTKLAMMEGITSCMDCSDGLARTLWILARENQAHLLINKIPIPPELQKVVPENELHAHALHGGEEFELVFTANAKLRDDLLKLSRETRIKLTPIGVVKKVGILKEGHVESKLPIDIEERGWDAVQHFTSNEDRDSG